MPPAFPFSGGSLEVRNLKVPSSNLGSGSWVVLVKLSSSTQIAPWRAIFLHEHSTSTSFSIWFDVFSKGNEAAVRVSRLLQVGALSALVEDRVKGAMERAREP